MKIIKVEHEVDTADNLGLAVKANHRRLGKTDLKVPFFAFGGSAISGVPSPSRPADSLTGWSNIHDDKARAAIHYWMYRQLNCFDMGGAAYGRGELEGVEVLGYSETLLGEALSLEDHRDSASLRTRTTIITKGGSVPLEYETGRLGQYTWENLDYGMDCTLERLQTDHVDVFLLHGHPQDEEPARNIVEQMEKLKSRASHLGVSLSINRSSPKETSEMWRKIYDDYLFLDCMMIRVNLLDDNDITYIWPWARDMDIGIIARSMLELGMLTTRALDVWGKDDHSEKTERTRKLRDFLVEQGAVETIEEAALRYAIQFVHTGALATLSPEHLDANIRAVLKGSLDDHLVEEVKKIRDSG